MNRKNKLLFSICLGIIFIISVSTSYAYFNTIITNKDVKDQVVTTGTLSLRYVDGAEIVMNNIKPGQTITKTVYVANTGTLDASYNLVWQELTNEIINNEMLVEGTCTRLNSTTEEADGTCEGVDSSAIAETIIKKKIIIEPNIIHKYDLIITFKDTNDEQNYNQGKKFSGVLGVEEYEPTQFEKDSWETIATNVRNGNISDYNLGDTKEVDLGDLGIHNVRIANTSIPSECSTEGFSQSACGFVLEFEDIITKYAMNSTQTNVGGWPASDMYTYLNTDIYNILPIDLKKIIIDTIVVSDYGKDGTDNFTSTDKLLLFDITEIYGNVVDGYTYTRQLDYYNNIGVSKSNYSNVKKNFIAETQNWWLRSCNSITNDNFMFVHYNNGRWTSALSSHVYGVSPAFRIG